MDNAVLLRYLRAHCTEVRALALRPTLNPHQWGLSRHWCPREDDAFLQPRYLGVPYVPKLGSHFNDKLVARYLHNALYQLGQEFGWDVVLCSWLFPDGAGLARVDEELRGPFALICQGSDAHQYLRDATRRSAILHAVRSSGGVVTRSADLARLLREAGAAPDKLHPIYNGADRSLFYPLGEAEREGLRAELGVPPGAPMTLFVGNFLPVKNPDLLLKAFSLARETFDQAHPGRPRPQLHLIGGGPLQNAMHEATRAYNLSDQVHFQGRKDAAGVARFMRAADVLCMSSLNEGVPNVILEAQAAGVPVVATHVGGIGEIIREPEQGELTAPGEVEPLAEALVRAWEGGLDASAAQKRKQCISRIGDGYTWEKTAKQYSELLQKL